MAIVDVDTKQLWDSSDFDALSNWQYYPMESFERWLAGEVVAQRRQFRETSAATYTYHFTAWLKFLQAKRMSLLEATPKEAAEFFASREVEPVSRRRYLQLLARVYRAIIALGWDGRNPMGMELKKELKLEPTELASLTDGQAEALFKSLKLLDGWKGDRDRAMLALMLGAGLRANEVIHLPLDAVGKDYSVRIRPSGVHRDHTSVILPGIAREYWESWVRSYQAWKVVTSLAFPATRKGRPYTESGLFRRIDTWLELAKLDIDERGANLLRNTFARQALASTRYRAEEVQEFLGHEELRATLRHADEEVLARIARERAEAKDAEEPQ